MATLSQILAGLKADQQLNKQETLGLLGESIFDSERLVKEGTRGYQEAADKFGLDFSDYEEKGDKIATAQTALSLIPGGQVASALLGFGARRLRNKPKFKFDLNQAAPGFDNRLFADQAGKDLLSSVEGTRDIVSQALKGSFFNDLVSTASSLYGGYTASKAIGQVSEDTLFMDWLRGMGGPGSQVEIPEIEGLPGPLEPYESGEPYEYGG